MKFVSNGVTYERTVVSELIAALQGMPQDAEVFYRSGPAEGYIYEDECRPDPTLEDDGRVCL